MPGSLTLKLIRSPSTAQTDAELGTSTVQRSGGQLTNEHFSESTGEFQGLNATPLALSRELSPFARSTRRICTGSGKDPGEIVTDFLIYRLFTKL